MNPEQPKPSESSFKGSAGIVIFCLVVLGLMMFFSVVGNRKIRDGDVPAVKNNLRNIAYAFISHSANYEKLPSTICSKDGKPLLSWRVAILPYIEQQSLYNQFHLDEPWDSPHNIQLLPKMPRIYALLDGSTEEPGMTLYRTFVGEKTLFAGPGGTPSYDIGTIPDGVGNTILVVVAAEAVPWTKPAEIEYAPDQPLTPLLKPFRGGFMVVLADGSIKVINKDISEESLRGMIEPADGKGQEESER